MIDSLQQCVDTLCLTRQKKVGRKDSAGETNALGMNFNKNNNWPTAYYRITCAACLTACSADAASTAAFFSFILSFLSFSMLYTRIYIFSSSPPLQEYLCVSMTSRASPAYRGNRMRRKMATASRPKLLWLEPPESRRLNVFFLRYFFSFIWCW